MARDPSLPNSPPNPSAPSHTPPTPVLVPEWPTPYGHSQTSSSITNTPSAIATTTTRPSSSTHTSGTAGTESVSKKSNGDGDDDDDDLDVDDALPDPASAEPLQNDQVNTADPNASLPASDADAERRRRRREERRQRQKEEADAARELELENDARRLFRCGFFALPLLWLVSLFYFHHEYKDENASDQIKKCTHPFFPFLTFLLKRWLSCHVMSSHTCFSCTCWNDRLTLIYSPYLVVSIADYARSRLMLIIYTAIFVIWFIIFQANKDSLSALNIQSTKGTSPSGI